ncbi:MAG: hypothetical protein RIR70_1935, partial [Pseudomonadota bacterium]
MSDHDKRKLGPHAKPAPMALEYRFMFDGALPAALTPDQTDHPDQPKDTADHD